MSICYITVRVKNLPVLNEFTILWGDKSKRLNQMPLMCGKTTSATGSQERGMKLRERWTERT